MHNQFQTLLDQLANVHKKEVTALQDEVAALRRLFLLREEMERCSGRTTELEEKVHYITRLPGVGKVLVVYPTYNQAHRAPRHAKRMNISANQLNHLTIGGLIFTHICIDPSAWCQITKEGSQYLDLLMYKLR